MPKISVIIPVYNAAQYLKRCLESVINQTLSDIEIICVDDCSTDNSLDILTEYALKDNRVKVIHHETNGGESKARNTGLDNAAGEYIAFIDNDDEIDLDFYEKLYRKAIETSSDIVKGEIHEVSYTKREIKGYLNERIRKYNSKFVFAFHWWTAIYKRDLIKSNNIRFIENYPLGGDVLFLNEAIIKCNKIELVDDTFYHYYKRENSGDSKILSFEKIKSAIKIFWKIFHNVEQTGIIDEGTCYSVVSWLVQMIQYPHRIKDEETLQFVVKNIVEYYSRAKKYLNWEQDERLIEILPIVKYYLFKENYDDLYGLYQRYNTAQKLICANLRFVHLKNKGNTVDV